MNNYNNNNNNNNRNRNRNSSNNEKTIEDIFKLYNPINEENNFNNGFSNQNQNINNINNNPNPMNSNIQQHQNNIDNSNNYNMNISSNLAVNSYNKVQENNNIRNNNIKKENKNSLNNIRIHRAEYIDYEELNKKKKRTMITLGLLQFFLFPIGVILTIVNKSIEKKYKIYLTTIIFSTLLIFGVIFTPIITNFYKEVTSPTISYNVNDDCAKLNNYITVYNLKMDALKPNELIAEENDTIDKIYYVNRSPYTYKIVMDKNNKLQTIIKIDSFGKTSLIIY